MGSKWCQIFTMCITTAMWDSECNSKCWLSLHGLGLGYQFSPSYFYLFNLVQQVGHVIGPINQGMSAGQTRKSSFFSIALALWNIFPWKIRVTPILFISFSWGHKDLIMPEPGALSILRALFLWFTCIWFVRFTLFLCFIMHAAQSYLLRAVQLLVAIEIKLISKEQMEYNTDTVSCEKST